MAPNRLPRHHLTFPFPRPPSFAFRPDREPIRPSTQRAPAFNAFVITTLGAPPAPPGPTLVVMKTKRSPSGWMS